MFRPNDYYCLLLYAQANKVVLFYKHSDNVTNKLKLETWEK